MRREYRCHTGIIKLYDQAYPIKAGGTTPATKPGANTPEASGEHAEASASDEAVAARTKPVSGATKACQAAEVAA